MQLVDTLIFAAHHLVMQHGAGIRLKWVYDIALLIRLLKSPSDWSELQEKSLEWGTVLSVQKALEMAQAWTGIVLPEGFADYKQ